AEPVEALGDPDLVLHGEGHPLALGPVAERRVVDPDFSRHRPPSSRRPGPGVKAGHHLSGSLDSPSSTRQYPCMPTHQSPPAALATTRHVHGVCPLDWPDT